MKASAPDKQLRRMLDATPDKWDSACGMNRPSRRRSSAWRDFCRRVQATKDAIRATLAYEPVDRRVCVPRVEAVLTDGVWHLTVHVWGEPWRERPKEDS